MIRKLSRVRGGKTYSVTLPIEIIREFGWIKSLVLTIGLAFYGILLAGLISRIISTF